MNFNTSILNRIVLEAEDDELEEDGDITDADNEPGEDNTDDVSDDSADDSDSGLDNDSNDDTVGEQSNKDKYNNLILIHDFINLHNAVERNSESISEIKTTNRLVTVVLNQVMQNLNVLKESLLRYIKTVYNKNKYVENLYQYNCFLEALRVNIEMISKLSEMNKES